MGWIWQDFAVGFALMWIDLVENGCGVGGVRLLFFRANFFNFAFTF